MTTLKTEACLVLDPFNFAPLYFKLELLISTFSKKNHFFKFNNTQVLPRAASLHFTLNTVILGCHAEWKLLPFGATWSIISNWITSDAKRHWIVFFIRTKLKKLQFVHRWAVFFHVPALKQELQIIIVTSPQAFLMWAKHYCMRVSSHPPR